MIPYPKIETLFKRDETFRVTDKLRLPEFALVREWLVTEKVDGTNIRVVYLPDHMWKLKSVNYTGGRR